MVDIEIKKKKKKKSKRKTKKRLSPEKLQTIINIYLNNKDVRKRKRKEAQQKRNPLNRLGGAYPIQNKAIDAISYSNQFRHTNDTRVMAMERGLNGLTGNMTQLTEQVRRLQAPPLSQPKPAIQPPSQNYLQRNPNYPSSLVGSSLDLENDAIIERTKGFEIEAQKIVDDTKSDIDDMRSERESVVDTESVVSLNNLQQAVEQSEKVAAQMQKDRLQREPSIQEFSDDGDDEEGVVKQAEKAGLSSLLTSTEDAVDLIPSKEKLFTNQDINDVYAASTIPASANKLIEYANIVGLNTIPYVDTNGLVIAGQIGTFKSALRQELSKFKKTRREQGGGK